MCCVVMLTCTCICTVGILQGCGEENSHFHFPGKMGLLCCHETGHPTTAGVEERLFLCFWEQMADCEEGDCVCEDSEWGHGDLAWQHEYAVSGAAGTLSHGQPPDLLLRRKGCILCRATWPPVRGRLETWKQTVQHPADNNFPRNW